MRRCRWVLLRRDEMLLFMPPLLFPWLPSDGSDFLLGKSGNRVRVIGRARFGVVAVVLSEIGRALPEGLRGFFSRLDIPNVDPNGGGGRRGIVAGIRRRRRFLAVVVVVDPLEEPTADSPNANDDALGYFRLVSPFRFEVQLLVRLHERSVLNVTGVVIRFATPTAQHVVRSNDDVVVSAGDRRKHPEHVLRFLQPTLGIGEDARKILNRNGRRMIISLR